MSNQKTAVIFGGSGKVARALTPLLTGATPAWNVVSVIRNADQSSALEAMGASTVVQSIEDASVDDIAQTLIKAAPTVVIWSAGAGGGDPSRTKSVDQEGAIKVMDAVARAQVTTKRFITVSALDVRDRNLDPPAWYNEDDLQRSERVWSAIGPYMRAKYHADLELVTGNEKRKLEYTIVRPGQLTDEPAKGTVSAGQVHLGNPISRGDVAAVILECIKNDATIGMAFDVLGGDVRVKEAVQQAALEKADTFKGQYTKPE